MNLGAMKQGTEDCIHETDSLALLAGRTVLVTGASCGIGAATARALHCDGTTVVSHYRSARTQAEALAEELGERVHLVQADLSEAHGPAPSPAKPPAMPSVSTAKPPLAAP